MLHSMTGFGEARVQDGAVTVLVEVRSVNNRHLKFALRSTESYGALEPLIETVVRGHLKRGTIQVSVRVDRAHGRDDYRVNRDVLDSYRQQMNLIAADWEVAAISMESLLALPGVVEDVSAVTADIAADWPIIESALVEALEAVKRMRAEEGAQLEADFRANLEQIGRHLDAIEARLPQVGEDYRTRLLDRLNRILEKHDLQLDAGDVIREISIFAERSDVSEEIVRLRSHVQQFAAAMLLAEGSGRKLEFITQEMFREANTIGSKSSDTVVSQHVVEIKVAIERMREQVQNVE